VLGHAAFLALLAMEAPRHLFVAPPPPQAIEVVMTAPPSARPTSDAEAIPSAAAPPETADRPPVRRVVRPSSSAPVTATEYFAAAVLDDPRNRKTRETLSSLGSDERLVQLCNIEAMEQLKRWKAGFVPDHIVAYATADPSLTAASIEAPGAAVHAGGKWYRLSFSCASKPDLSRIAAFAFKLGRPIPKQEWEQDSLPELVDGDPTD
jgi:hypothetical protein